MKKTKQKKIEKRSNKSKLYGWLAGICIVAGLGLCSTGLITSELVTQYHPKITRQSLLSQNKNKHKKVSYDMSKTKSADMNSALKARANEKQVRILGQMLVPSDKVHLPINEGVSNTSLLLGAGTMRQDQILGQGNYAMAGHHMINKHALFTPLWYHAHIGTKVYLTNMKDVYTYKINTRKIISPYDVSVVNNTVQPKLTLITCNDSGSKRLLLSGKLTKKQKLSNSPKWLRKDMNKRVNNHNVLEGY